MLVQKVIRLFSLMALLTIASCSTQTKLYESWHDKEFFGPKLEKVLVLGIFKDDIQRRMFEANFVKEVDLGGKKAIAGYTLMPDKDDFDTKEDILAAVKKTGADSVLITSFKGVIEKQHDVPPRVDYVPRMGMRYGRYGYGYRGYYGSTYEAVYRPGYTVTDKIVQLETRVYSVKNEKLVWAGKTKSVNASSAESVIKDLVALIIKDMKDNGLIK